MWRAPLIYHLWLQRAEGMMIVRYEFFKVAFALAVAIAGHTIIAAYQEQR
jgi:hypothetical protein